jgi:glycerol uptake facilitator-like aquaporin
VSIMRYSDQVPETSAIGVAQLCGKIGGENCHELKGSQGWKMLLAEIIGTFLFVNVNVNIIFNNGSKEIILNAIIIGSALMLGLMVAAPISGAAINPAVGLVLPVLQNVLHEVPANHIAIHVFGPYIGGALAGLFQLLYKSAINKM